MQEKGVTVKVKAPHRSEQIVGQKKAAQKKKKADAKPGTSKEGAKPGTSKEGQ